MEQCRKSFIRKHLLPRNFDFFKYTRYCVDEDMAQIIETHWLEWIIYLLYILIVGASGILWLQLMVPLFATLLLALAGIQIQHVLFCVAVLHEDDEVRLHTSDIEIVTFSDAVFI